MITLQHTAVSILALWDKNRDDSDKFFKELISLGWILLPDAIRAYVGPRQPSHFEETPDGTDVSWMEFPMPDTLWELNKEASSEVIEYYVAATPKCVVGERTNLSTFDRHNYTHPYFHEIRAHLLQDCILDEVVRKLVDVSNRFDDTFVVNHNHSVMTGNEFRKEIAVFEQIGFLHLVGEVYKKTGLLLNQDWYDKNVYPILLATYPRDLADNTYKYMRIPEEINLRIQKFDFDVSNEDVRIAGNNLVEVLDDMYAKAYLHTYRELC